jgi:dTDP-4-dehydrorhamnose 3,5-epimerase
MATKAVEIAEERRIASSGNLELALPECPKGIGDLIGAADSPRLIADVRVQPLALWPDDRGYFLEVQRMGRGLAAEFPAATTQVSAAVNYPGTIKAFHYHLHQTDCWTPVGGLLQIALVDLRAGSATYGARNTLYAGALRPWQILIPPGVAHGYKVVGQEPALLVYLTDRFYNPTDEGRIAYDDPHINYDWATQHK